MDPNTAYYGLLNADNQRDEKEYAEALSLWLRAKGWFPQFYSETTVCANVLAALLRTGSDDYHRFRRFCQSRGK